jgi:ABC-type phosphate/phosphonate transport system substrate-binding protein
VIAALPMYDRPETAAANDRLWQAIGDRLRAQGLAAPVGLTRDRPPMAVWTDPALVLAQTCGLPFRRDLRDRVDYVATPVYDLPDCPAGFYRSVLVARVPAAGGALHRWRRARLAVNEAGSQSGYAAPQMLAALHGFRFDDLVFTGSHRNAARAVAEGRADLAALDAVSWAMMRRWDGFAGHLSEVARTPPTPGLPLVTARGGSVAALAAGVAAAIDALAPDDRQTLLLRGLVQLDPAAYDRVPRPPGPVGARGR